VHCIRAYMCQFATPQVKVDSFLVTNLHESAQRWFSHIDELEEKHQRELRRKAR
jgi:hypothetical protein